jgi:hypothetical protein
MFVVPARYSVIQVMFDIMQKAPATLVSYQGAPQTSQPVLHAWNGTEWVRVALEDFKSGAFMQNKPAQVVVVGEANFLPPVLLSAVKTWCPNALALSEVDTASLVNASGRLLHFSRSDWRWFAARYKMDLKDKNAADRKGSWYYEAHPELPNRAKYAETPAAPVAPAAAEPAAPVAEPAPAVPAAKEVPAAAKGAAPAAKDAPPPAPEPPALPPAKAP